MHLLNSQEGQILLETKGLVKQFRAGGNVVTAVDHVRFKLHDQEIVSIVGESASGKTTFIRMLQGLLKETSGEIFYQGKQRLLRDHQDRKQYWSNVQSVFQDPFSTFNQFFRVERILKSCFRLNEPNLSALSRQKRMEEACDFVNLSYREIFYKYPFELSGGQMQRLMIARIFAMQPRILIADEPTSMVDACSRAAILDMFFKLRKERGMTILLVTHDLGLAYYISDTLYIMKEGRFVEEGSADSVVLDPKYPYTKQLMADARD